MKKRILMGVGVFFLCLLGFLLWYFLSLRPVGKDETILFEISPKTPTVTIIKELKNSKLIRSELATKMYIFLTKNDTLQAGKYELNKNMSTNEIIKKIDDGDVFNDNITITFKEGKRLTNYVSQIHEAFNYDTDTIMNTISNKDFLNSLISKYWFLNSDILNSSLYYPLEGYLYPDTYEFDKNATIEDIIIKMLDNMEDKLEPYKEEFNNSSYSFSKLLTLASIVELEAQSTSDRYNVSGVFYNRLKSGWTLGSDVTAYYGAKKELTDVITQSDLNDCNPYNTRSTCVSGIPLGPICSPSIDAIIAALKPTANDYYFFVADKNFKVYFSKTSAEQDIIIATLKSQNLWYNY